MYAIFTIKDKIVFYYQNIAAGQPEFAGLQKNTGYLCTFSSVYFLSFAL